ncbi:hypothetical protein EI94DRAFT_1780982 [Lactarius quietus]|nr:hypothetical protein EI94DRAFT_1780982 [Lactarius quietus]
MKDPTSGNVFVTRYPGGMAGAVHSKARLGQNETYRLWIGEESQGNIYAPFASQIDWEVARWAKMRGPSLNSFTELMAIDGMKVHERLRLSFKNSRELNQLIDTHLPGCPPFQRKEILVGDEVCKLYFRDIVQCIRALFGDPDFAPYLILAPERHYTDEEKDERVYHDMYTGGWWWFTQVAIEKELPGVTIVPVLISSDKTQLTPFQNKSAYPVYMMIGNIPKEFHRKASMRAYVLLGYLPTTKLKQENNQAKQKWLTTNLYHACLQHILRPLINAGNHGVFMSTATSDVHHVHPILASFIGDYPEQVLTTCTLTGDCPRCSTTTEDLGNFDPDDVPTPRSLEQFLKVLASFHQDPAGFLQATSQICAKPVPHPFWLELPQFNIFQSITPDILHQLYQGVIKHLKAWILSACDPSEIDARCCRLPPNHNIHLFTKGISQEHEQISCFMLGLILDIQLPNNICNYPIHTYLTLRLITDTLSRFHANRGIFIALGIRYQFNLPKLHYLLHIDLIKDAYAATNHKDKPEQMTTYNECQERIRQHQQYIEWRQSGAPTPMHIGSAPPSFDTHWDLTMTKHPSLKAVGLNMLQDAYGAPLFKVALRYFISATNDNNQSRQQLEHSLWMIRLPFTHLPVWHMIKFTQSNPLTATRYHVGHIHVVFSIPERYHDSLFKPAVKVPLHLAYVQWYLQLTEPDPNHGMFKIRLQTDGEGSWICSIVLFGPAAPSEWTSSNVLDRCTIFYLNTFSDAQIFRMTT